MSDYESPISRLGRAYEQFRQDPEARKMAAWSAAGAGTLIGLNLWIALTEQGRDVWAWFVG